MLIKIYEPPLCCSTGVCGPEPDKQLIELQNLINVLSKKGWEVKRFAINQQPLEFTKNDIIKNIIKDNGIDVLPITLVDDKVVKTGSYPSFDDFKEISSDLDLNSLDEILIQ